MEPESQTRFKRPESILLVTFTQQGQTLLLKRHWHHTFWQSVTGSIHWSGETPVETAVRELAEETGIVARPDQIQDWKRRFKFVIPREFRHRFGPGVTMNVEHLFSLQLTQKVPVRIQAGEHSAYQWVDFNKAEDIVWSWTNREALRMIRDGCR